jgi:hypothetical protein
MTSLPVKNDGVRGASFIITCGSVMTWPFLFVVPMMVVFSITRSLPVDGAGQQSGPPRDDVMR